MEFCRTPKKSGVPMARLFNRAAPLKWCGKAAHFFTAAGARGVQPYAASLLTAAGVRFGSSAAGATQPTLPERTRSSKQGRPPLPPCIPPPQRRGVRCGLTPASVHAAKRRSAKRRNRR
jgi:hypothetical protein